VTARPADYPPPFGSSEFVRQPSDAPDDRIEVGVLVVGAGPAGLAFAIRFGQLLEADPETAERLGDVPLAVLEKGKQPGSHLLSGAVVNPRSLQRLFGDRVRIDDIPSYGRVQRESVYFLTSGRALRIPTPPTMRSKGHIIFSLSQLGRWLTQQAEEAGAMVLSETAAEHLLIADGAVVGVRTGDRGRGLEGEALGNFEPGNDILAKVTVLAEGTQGHLTGVALDHFGLHGSQPQVWELGVKEVWKVPRPLDRIITSLGWPLRPQAKFHEFGGAFIYPMGDDMVTIGMVVGLDYRDVELSPHDLLQELKTHPSIRSVLDGGSRLEWGAKTIPGGGFYSLPRTLHAPGVLFCGDGAGMVNIPALKGVHYAIESGRLAAEAAFAAVKAGESTSAATLASFDEAVRSSFIWQDLYEVRDMRGVFGRGLLVGAACAGTMAISKGRISIGKVRAMPDATHTLLRSDRASRYPAPDGKLTFDKTSSVFIAGNKTRDDQPDHIRIEHRVPRDVADLWEHMCPAQVYTSDESSDGIVTVHTEPSNCVQCGAITAKGGRLTPPEGGSGPEYSQT
jgi:electron-transferring-flavoprotein dehydrogenase